MSTIFQRAIKRAWETGHFWSPTNPNGMNVSQSQLELLQPTDEVAIQALISASIKLVFFFCPRMSNIKVLTSITILH